MFDGYKPSHVDLNSPMINKLAYSPAMNRHIDQIKAHKRAQNDRARSGSMNIGLEAADHMRHLAKGTVSRTFVDIDKLVFNKIRPKFCFMCDERIYTAYLIGGKMYGDCHKGQIKMSNADRRHNHLKQDPDLPDFKKQIDHAKRQSTKQRSK